jgi:hypothetical protein
LGRTSLSDAGRKRLNPTGAEPICIAFAFTKIIELFAGISLQQFQMDHFLWITRREKAKDWHVTTIAIGLSVIHRPSTGAYPGES